MNPMINKFYNPKTDAHFEGTVADFGKFATLPTMAAIDIANGLKTHPSGWRLATDADPSDPLAIPAALQRKAPSKDEANATPTVATDSEANATPTVATDSEANATPTVAKKATSKGKAKKATPTVAKKGRRADAEIYTFVHAASGKTLKGTRGDLYAHFAKNGLATSGTKGCITLIVNAHRKARGETVPSSRGSYKGWACTDAPALPATTEA